MTNTDTSVKEEMIQEFKREFIRCNTKGEEQFLRGIFIEEIEQFLSTHADKLFTEGKRQGVERLISKYASSHEVFCEKKGKQFKKCLRCVLDDELKSLSQKKK